MPKNQPTGSYDYRNEMTYEVTLSMTRTMYRHIRRKANEKEWSMAKVMRVAISEYMDVEPSQEGDKDE